MVSKSALLYPEFYERYIKLAEEKDHVGALKGSSNAAKKLFKKISEKKSLKSYATGKWTLREMLQHIIDAERVFVYRALSFSRMDETPLPGFDENAWAANSAANTRSWKSLVKEFTSLRKSNIAFFESLNEQQLMQKGNANGNDVNVLALGFICSGHLNHHINIIQQRYLGKKKFDMHVM